MKKGIIVLLVAVLAAGFAFASLKGSASIGYTFDIKSKDNGITNSNSTSYKFTFALDEATGESKGDGKVYAEIAAEATAEVKESGVAISAEVTKANIIAGDFTIDILGPKGAFGYAADYMTVQPKKGDPATPVYNFANNYDIDSNGFVVSYSDYSLAFAYKKGTIAASDATNAVYGWKDADNDPSTAPVWGVVTAAKKSTMFIYAGAETKSFELAEGLTAQAGANFYMKDDVKQIGAAAKTSYKNEDAKLTASLAVDGEYVIATEKFAMDIAATATYDFVTAKVYFGTVDGFQKGSNVLNAKLSVAKTIKGVTLSAYGEARDVIAIEHPWILAGAKAEYKADGYKVYAACDASLKYSTKYEVKNWKMGETKGAGLGVSAGVSTTTLIDNCTVALDWKGADFTVVEADKTTGAITLSATVAF